MRTRENHTDIQDMVNLLSSSVSKTLSLNLSPVSFFDSVGGVTRVLDDGC